MEEWAELLLKEEYAEAAAKCYLSAGQPSNAVKVLGRKQDPAAIHVAAYIARSFGDAIQATTYADKCMFECLVREDYELATKVLMEHPEIKSRILVLHTHKCLLSIKSQWDLADSELKKDSDILMQAVYNRWLSEGCINRNSDESLLHEYKEGLQVCSWEESAQTEAQVITYLSLTISKSLLSALRGDFVNAFEELLAAFIVAHRTCNNSFYHWFGHAFSPDYNIVGSFSFLMVDRHENTANPTLQALQAYINLAHLHKLLSEEHRHTELQMRGSASFETTSESFICFCEEKLNLVKTLITNLLKDEQAKVFQLRTRLTYTKIALASALARQKGKASTSVNFECDVGKLGNTMESLLDNEHVDAVVEVEKVPADKLIEHPHITVPQLQESCRSMEEEIANMDDNIQVKHFPDPLESTLLLAKLCGFYKGSCHCHTWDEVSVIINQFGKQCSALDRQIVKLDKLLLE